MSFLDLQWWVYVSLVASFFGICMGLNYLVKKFNEAKIDERLIRMLQKASTTQSTQVNGPLIAVETGGAARLNTLKTVEQPSPPGISLVFNREENKRRSDPYKLIKPRLSLETVNVIPPSARTVKSVPLKRIGSAHVVTNINSSLNSTEKVDVKNNEYRRQTAKESSSIVKSDCYVTQLVTVQENKFLTLKDSNTSKSVSDGRVSESSTFIQYQDDTAKESVTKIQFDGIKVEGTTPDKQNDSITAKVLIQNIHDERSVSSNIIEIAENSSIGLCDTKSNEEINTGCFIKRSVESILSKFANLKNKNENQKIVQNVSDILIAAQQSLNHSESRRNVTEIFSVEKKESKCSATKQSSYPSEIVNAEKNFPVKNIDSENPKETSSDSKKYGLGEIIPGKTTDSQHIAAKETTSSHCHTGRTEESLPVIKFEFLKHIATKEITSSHSHSDRTEEIFPVKTSDSKHIAAKETTSSHSHSDRAGDIFPVKTTDSVHIAARDTTSSHCNRIGENFPVKRSESEHTAAKETLLYAGIEPLASELLLSVKKSVNMIESRRVNSEKTFCPSTKSITRTNYKAIEYFPITKRKDSGGIVAKETVSDTRSYPIVTQMGLNEENATGQVAAITPFYIRSGITINKHSSTENRESGSSADKETPNTNIKTQIDDNVAKSSPVKMTEAARNDVKAKYLKELVLEKNKEDVESNNSLKKIEDGTVMPETSKNSDDSEEEPRKSLTDKIKELLEDENTVDIKLHKPSSSTKE